MSNEIRAYAEANPSETVAELAERFGVTPATVRNYLRRPLDWEPGRCGRKPGCAAPGCRRDDDVAYFEANPGRTLVGAAEDLGLHVSTVSRWAPRELVGRAKAGRHDKRELVVSYLEGHPGESHLGAARALGISNHTVSRWARDAGL